VEYTRSAEAASGRGDDDSLAVEGIGSSER
jgi:hypothetical protein